MLGGVLLLLAGLASSQSHAPVTVPSQGDAAPDSRTSARGQRIDLELQDADIHEVLRTFAEIGNVNIVAEQGVAGRVTARFRATPWDQALNEILRSLSLDARRDGNVIYVCVRE